MKRIHLTLDDDTYIEVVAGNISGTASLSKVIDTVFGELNVNQTGAVRTLLGLKPKAQLSKFLIANYEEP